MPYPQYGGHIDDVLRGTDSIAIINNREYSYKVAGNKDNLYLQLGLLDRFHKVERVYHGLDFQIILPRLEAAIKEANSLRKYQQRRPRYIKVDFTRRLTKAKS